MTRMTGPDCVVMCNLINTYYCNVAILFVVTTDLPISPRQSLLLSLTFSVLVANPKKTTLHGGQSRSWSAEQGKKEKEKVYYLDRLLG